MNLGEEDHPRPVDIEIPPLNVDLATPAIGRWTGGCQPPNAYIAYTVRVEESPHIQLIIIATRTPGGLDSSYYRQQLLGHITIF